MRNGHIWWLFTKGYFDENSTGSPDLQTNRLPELGGQIAYEKFLELVVREKLGYVR
jgi:hypothetical protein